MEDERLVDHAAILYALNGWHQQGGMPPSIDDARETFNNVRTNSPIMGRVWLERARMLQKLLQEAEKGSG